MKRWLLVLLSMALLSPLTALADSITPDSYTDTLAVGESVTITKTVEISGAPATALLDVNFLFDTTGSMGSLITSAKASAAAITTALSAYGDVTFGVGHYEDFATSPWGGSGDVPYEQVTDQTDATAAIAAINSLSLGYGSDWPESGLYGLEQTAETTSWRDDSTRVVVWFGDAPCHDPADTPGYPGPTVAETIAALTGENIVVVAIDLSRMDDDGDVTAITTATGGSKYTGSVDAGTISGVIEGLVEDVFASYSEVTLSVAGAPGVDVSWDPTKYTGDFSRAVTESFEFDVTFTGVTAGTYDFAVHALADGGIIATERDHIVVTGGAPVPEPGTFLLLGAGLAGLGYMHRRRKNG